MSKKVVEIEAERLAEMSIDQRVDLGHCLVVEGTLPDLGRGVLYLSPFSPMAVFVSG